MSAVLEAAPSSVGSTPARGRGVWAAAWRRLRQDRVGMFSLAAVVAFLVLIALTALHLVAADWQQERAVPSAPPTFVGPAPPPAPGADAIPVPKGPPVDISDVDPLAPRYREWAELAARYRTVEKPKALTLPLGADRLGRDVLSKTLKATQTSVFVGLVAALVATAIGTLLGALAGFFGRWVNDVLEWFYSVFTAIPDILLILSFAVVFGRGIDRVALILAFVGWTGVYRQVRAEFIKHASREYVRSAEAIGASATSRMFRHILPNVSHVILVRMSLLVVGFIKAEVILSYLGLGVGVDDVSWGTMLAEAQSELIVGHWWQLAAATAFMAAFVTAFSLMTDALRDALDPRLRGLG
jgi:peptide/nickel transport system permease protein